MSHMKINPAEVEGHANAMKNTAEQSLNDSKTQLVNMVNQLLDDIWQGQGAEGFRERFTQIADPSFEAIRTALDNLCQDLVINAKNYQDFDQESSNANRNV